MPERTGLGPLELAVLRAVEVQATAGARRQRTTTVLERLEVDEGIGPAYALPVVRDLGTPWRVHLRLLDLGGNWGSVHGDPMADPRYTKVRLSRVGELALASERGEVGSVPIGLVDGSLYRGGRVPPLGVSGVLRALGALLDGPGMPNRRLVRLLGTLELPGGGRVEGRLAGLYAGRRTRLRLVSRFERERGDTSARLVVTGVPLGATVDEVAHHLARRASREAMPGRRDVRPPGPAPEMHPNAASDDKHHDPGQQPLPVRDIRDESSSRAGIRVVIAAPPDADLDVVEQWTRDVWPVTLDAGLRLPARLGDLLRRSAETCRRDRSGLDQLADITRPTAAAP